MRGRVDPVFVGSAAELPETLSSILCKDDILLMMGAGDIGTVAAKIGREGLCF
jgi:UDP-N-acetylmuramate--alanine ligase